MRLYLSAKTAIPDLYIDYIAVIPIQADLLTRSEDNLDIINV